MTVVQVFFLQKKLSSRTMRRPAMILALAATVAAFAPADNQVRVDFVRAGSEDHALLVALSLLPADSADWSLSADW